MSYLTTSWKSLVLIITKIKIKHLVSGRVGGVASSSEWRFRLPMSWKSMALALPSASLASGGVGRGRTSAEVGRGHGAERGQGVEIHTGRGEAEEDWWGRRLLLSRMETRR